MFDSQNGTVRSNRLLPSSTCSFFLYADTLQFSHLSFISLQLQISFTNPVSLSNLQIHSRDALWFIPRVKRGFTFYLEYLLILSNILLLQRVFHDRIHSAFLCFLYRISVSQKSKYAF